MASKESGALREGDEVLIRGTVKRIDPTGAPVIVIADRREGMGNWTFQPRDVTPVNSGIALAHSAFAALSLSSPIERCEHDKTDLGHVHTIAEAQASSEIRAKMMASFDKVIPSFEMRVQIVSCILRALTPSRQGAGKP